MRKIIHVVDDDASVRAATSFLLCAHGYSTRIYDGGREFLRQADLEVGCVLLDLRMAEMSGLEVLEALRERRSGAPVIILTGHGDVATAVLALKLGAVDYIQKPYDEGELIAAIERAVAGEGREARSTDAKRAALDQVARLSGREKQVLRGLLGGMTNKEMARLLDLSPRTIEMHRSTMMADLGIDAAADAIRIAIAAELTPLDECRSTADDEAQAVPRPGPTLVRSSPARAPGLHPVSLPALGAFEASTDCALLLDRGFQIVFLDKDGQQQIAIRALADARGEIEVTVTDRGIGAPDEPGGQLLLPFASTRARSAGVALTVSRNILAAHCGRVPVESSEGGAPSTGFTVDPQLHARAA